MIFNSVKLCLPSSIWEKLKLLGTQANCVIKKKEEEEKLSLIAFWSKELQEMVAGASNLKGVWT